MTSRNTQMLIAAFVILQLMVVGTLADDAKALPVVKGEVVKVDASSGKITIKHEAIPNLGMDPMTMVFKASDPAMLQVAKPGEKIRFTADRVNGQLSIMTMDERK